MDSLMRQLWFEVRVKYNHIHLNNFHLVDQISVHEGNNGRINTDTTNVETIIDEANNADFWLFLDFKHLDSNTYWLNVPFIDVRRQREQN